MKIFSNNFNIFKKAKKQAPEKPPEQDCTIYTDNYNFYHNPNNGIVVCTTFYKGKLIRGIAKCAPEDSFDLNIGKQLAYLRCVKKFALKKYNHATEVFDIADMNLDMAQKKYCKALAFTLDAGKQLNSVEEALAELEAKLNK